MIHTKTLCPGAKDFMPPECLDESPKYDTQLNVFSFGHLTIYIPDQSEGTCSGRQNDTS